MQPPITGNNVYLRPVLRGDYDLLYAVETSSSNLVRYRHRGQTIPPEQFPDRLWRGVLVQFIVCQRESHTPVALVAAYGADLRNRHAYIAELIFDQYQGRGWPQEGMELFIDYLFEVFELHKVYGETSTAVASAFSSIDGGVFREEGRLRDHERIEGQFHDRLIYALYAEDWSARDRGFRRPSVLAEQVRKAYAEGQSRRKDGATRDIR